MNDTTKPTIQDWNIGTAEAYRILGDLRRRTDITLSPAEEAAIGAGRMALYLMLPGERARVTPEMVSNAMIACAPPVREALALGRTAEQALEWIIQRAMATFAMKFNKYRPDGAARRRRS